MGLISIHEIGEMICTSSYSLVKYLNWKDKKEGSAFDSRDALKLRH